MIKPWPLNLPSQGAKLTDSLEREWAAWESAEQASFDEEAAALARYGLVALSSLVLLVALAFFQTLQSPAALPA